MDNKITNKLVEMTHKCFNLADNKDIPDINRKLIGIAGACLENALFDCTNVDVWKQIMEIVTAEMEE